MHHRVIFLDVVETLFSLEPLADEFEASGLPRATGTLFFAQLLRDAFALSATGVFHSFPEIARSTLEVLLGGHHVDVDEAGLERILGALARLPAHEDAGPALQRLHGADCRTVLLTNGTRANTEKLVHDNGLSQWVDEILSVDDFQVWKPSPGLYRAAVAHCGCEAREAALIAAHAWDVHGAMNAGLNAIWLQRQDASYHSLMGQPAAITQTLDDAVTAALDALHIPVPRA